MGLSINKREKLMIIILLGVLYAFILIKFILLPIIPEIIAKNEEINNLNEQKRLLDEEVANIESTRQILKSKEICSIRFDEYLLNSASITDGINMIEKLALLLGKEVKDITIGKPEEFAVSSNKTTENKQNNETVSNGDKKDNSNAFKNNSPKVAEEQQNANVQKKEAGKFYEFTIDFSTTMTFDEAYKLLQYCEGATQKIRVAKFEMQPLKKKDNSNVQSNIKDTNNVQSNKNEDTVKSDQQNTTQPEQASEELSQKYDIKMKICFYSQSLGNVNKLYEFSKGSFQKYHENNNNTFIKPEEDKDGKVKFPDIAFDEKMSPAASKQVATTDLIISGKGYLMGGDNFELYSGYDYYKGIRLSTKENINASLRVDNLGYYIEAYTENGNGSSISGFLKDNDFSLSIDMTIPPAKENEKLGLNLKIANDSGRNINIKLSDRYSKARLYDRSGNRIISKSLSERVFII